MCVLFLFVCVFTVVFVFVLFLFVCNCLIDFRVNGFISIALIFESLMLLNSFLQKLQMQRFESLDVWTV